MYIDHSKYYIEEFRFSPVGLEPYTKVDIASSVPPIEIYSSPQIQKRAIEQFEESSIIKPILKTVETGIKNRKIIIGYTNPSKFKFLYNKIKLAFGIKKNYALGFYFNLQDTIYLVLDDNISITGNAKYKIDGVLVHELCHMAAKNYKQTNYLQNVSSTYMTFYTNFLIHLISNQFQLIDSKDTINILTKNVQVIYKAIEELHKDFDSNEKGNFSVSYQTIYNHWFYLLGDLFFYNKYLTSDEINQITAAIFGLYLENFQDKPANSKYTHYTEAALYKAYRSIGINNLTTHLGQEIVFPSEMIAISNQNGLQPNMIKSINKINMGK